MQRRIRRGAAHPTVPLVRRYGADSQLRNPRQFFADWRAAFRGSWPVARRLLLRDLRSRYRQSLLGYFWLLAPALATTLVWQYLSAARIVNAGATRIPYIVYVLVGTMLWQSFTDALTSPIQQLSSSANLLSKMAFPAESLFLAGLGSVILSGLIRLALLIPVLAWYDVAPGFAAIGAPIGLLLVVNLGFGLGLLLAPFGALYRDIGYGLSIVTMFWFLITPVVYVPPTDGIGRTLVSINPVAPQVNVTRDWLTGGPAVPGTAWFVSCILGVLLLAAGAMLVRVSMPHLVDRMGS